MGCDIHLHEEIKVNGEWLNYGTPNIPRNYRLFAKMANVRNNFDIQPISEPKGIPDNVSKVTKLDLDYWGIDAYSHSYLNSKEIEVLYGWFSEYLKSNSNEFTYVEKDYFDYLFGSSFSGLSEFGYEGTSIPKEIEDVRFVFWFDN